MIPFPRVSIYYDSGFMKVDFRPRLRLVSLDDEAVIWYDKIVKKYAAEVVKWT